MNIVNQYSDEQILDSLRDHMVEKMLSKYSMSKPTYQCIAKRVAKDSEFASKVHTVENEAMAKWENVGLKALFEGDPSFNTQLFKMYVGSKKAFLEHSVLKMEEKPLQMERPQLVTHVVSSMEEYTKLVEMIGEE